MTVVVFGVGLMGAPIAAKLSQADFPVMACNRTPEKLVPLKEQGCTVTTHPEEAIAAGDYLILTLSDAAAIETVIFQITGLNLQGKTVIQMGTIAPEESREIATKTQQAGGKYLEAPVLGSIPEAKAGTLLVMAGGDGAVFEACLPILRQLGKQPMYIGEVGSAAALKLALNQLIAALTSGFALSLGLIEKEGVDRGKFMAILRDSALYAPTFDKKLQRMGDRQFANPNFPTKHLLKDTNLFLQAAGDAGLNATGLEGIQRILAQAIAANFADADYSSIYDVIVPG